MKLDEFIKDYRTRHDLTMQELADRMGVSKAYVGFLEQGKNPSTDKPFSPRMKTCKKMAAGLGMDVDSFIKLLEGGEYDAEVPSFYHDPDVAQFANAVHKNPDLRILFHASKNLDKDSLNSVVDFVKFQKAKAEGGAWDE